MQELAVDAEQLLCLRRDGRGQGFKARRILVKFALDVLLGPLYGLVLLAALVLNAFPGAPGIAPIPLRQAGGHVGQLPGQFPFTASTARLDDAEGHLIDQVADLPGAVLVPLPLVAGVRDLRRFQILDRFLQEEGLRPMLIPGSNGLLHLLKDFLFLRLAGLQLLFQVLDGNI